MSMISEGHSTIRHGSAFSSPKSDTKNFNCTSIEALRGLCANFGIRLTGSVKHWPNSRQNSQDNLDNNLPWQLESDELLHRAWEWYKVPRTLGPSTSRRPSDPL
jgi:hypothetical protein